MINNENNIKEKCYELLDYTSKHAYSDLQITIDILDDVDYTVHSYLDEENDEWFQHAENFGSMAYRIDNIVETLKYKRTDNFTCKDLETLKDVYTYCNDISNLIREINNF